MPDFDLMVSGSLAILDPMTERAREWVANNIGPDNGYQPYYPAVLCEHRYLDDILEALFAGGFTFKR